MIVLNALLLAGECFFGGSLLLVLALVLARGQSASQRHLIVTGAFVVLLALPFASLALPSHLVWYLAAAPQMVQSQTVAAVAPALDLAAIVFGFGAVWAMGAIFVLSRAAFGAVALQGLYRASVPHIPEGLSGEKFAGLPWQLRLRTAPGEVGPITWGILRPIVLLPKSSVTWSRARLEAVLLHEAAHVRRKDCLSRLIALAACALYWPNPLVWVAARVMRRDGETAADDVVLSSGIKASAYAEHLVGLARAFAGSRPSYAGVSLAMAEPAMLDARIEAILHPNRSRQAIRKSDVLKIAALGLTATAVMALARPSLAEARPEARPVIAGTHPAQTDLAPTDRTRRAMADAVTPETPLDVPPAPPAIAVPPAPAASAVPPAPPVIATPPVPPSHVTLRWEAPGEARELRWEISRRKAQARAQAESAAAAAKAEQGRALAKEQVRYAAMPVQMNAADVLREHASDFAKARVELAKAQATFHEAMSQANISVSVSSAAVSKAVVQAMKSMRPAIKRALADSQAEIVIKVKDDE